MVVVTVKFSCDGAHWNHDFEVPIDTSVLQLKETMLKPEGGTKQDVDAFELQLLGRRVPDFEKIKQECTLDFEYLGERIGPEKARLDLQDESRWEQLQQPLNEPPQRDRLRTPIKSATAGYTTSVPSSTQPKVAEVLQVKPAPRPPGATRKGPLPVPQRWKVVGGGDKGGILVREGQSTSSNQLPDRLSTGAFIEEISKQGERLNYKRLTGTGPETGWVSLTVSGKEIVRQEEMTGEIMMTLERALSLQEELMEGFNKPEFQKALDRLIAEYGNTPSNPTFSKKRSELFMTVQGVALPRYGFEASAKGVVKMMSAYNQPHLFVKEVAENNEQMGKLLRM